MEDHKQYAFKSEPQFLPEQDILKDWASSPTIIRTNKGIRVKDTFFVNDSEIGGSKGRRIGLTLSPSVYTITPTDFFIGVQSVSVAPTLTLPPALGAGLGKIYIIKDLSGSASATTITISRSGTDTIDGDTSTAINTNYGFKGFFTDGANWFTS